MRSLVRYSLISRCIGVLLLTAAALKVHGLRVDAVASLGMFSATEFKVALVEFEIFLGLWLLSGKGVIGSWLTGVFTFAAFALASAYQGWVGQASCGCFGRLSQWVSPWHALGLDLTVLLLLVLGRPELQALRQQPRGALRAAFVPLVIGLLGVFALLGILAGAAHLAYGSTDAALAQLRGETLSVRPRLVDVGQGAPGELREGSVTLVNRTDHAIRVIGGTSDCSCVATQGLPITIEPGETKSISVWVRYPAVAGLFTRRVALFTDDDGVRSVPFRLTGRIVAVTEASSAGADGK